MLFVTVSQPFKWSAQPRLRVSNFKPASPLHLSCKRIKYFPCPKLRKRKPQRSFPSWTSSKQHFSDAMFVSQMSQEYSRLRKSSSQVMLQIFSFDNLTHGYIHSYCSYIVTYWVSSYPFPSILKFLPSFQQSSEVIRRSIGSPMDRLVADGSWRILLVRILNFRWVWGQELNFLRTLAVKKQHFG